MGPPGGSVGKRPASSSGIFHPAFSPRPNSCAYAYTRSSPRKRLFLVDSREDAAGRRIHHQDGAVPPPKAFEGGGADHRVLAGRIIVRGGVAERTHPPGIISPSTAPPARTGGAHLRLPMRPYRGLFPGGGLPRGLSWLTGSQASA